jgi:hypothetical protein
MRDNPERLLNNGSVRRLDGDNQLSKKNFSRLLSILACAVVGASALLGFTHAALAADAATFGDVLCNAFENAKPFASVFESIAYVSGALSTLRGVHLLRLHADDPRNNKLGVPLIYLAGAMVLLALPSFIVALENSFFVPAQGGGGSCQAGAVAAATGLENVLHNFISNFREPLLLVTSLTAILSGLFMIVRGLIKASKYGTDPKTHSIHSILTNVGFGAFLMMIGSNLNMMLATVFGKGTSMGNVGIDSKTVLAWKAVDVLGGSEKFALAIASALTFVQLIGAIAFVRGWLILKKVVEGGSNASLTQGLTHILGGVLAINIGGFLEIMDKTFGTGLLTP